MKRILVFVILGIAVLFFPRLASAEKVTILYTGETHADLYPCYCPVEPFGGLARRATIIKELRQSFPNLLVVDSGGFFAGGKLDEYSVDENLDKRRTELNLSILKQMGYDALGIGDEEFNFGKDFLEKEIARNKLNFISCNVKVKGAQEYLVKEIDGVKIGILAVTPNEKDLKGIPIAEPIESVMATIEKLRNKEKVDLVILLSHLGEEADRQLLQEVKGIDFLITGHAIFGQDKESLIGDTILLRPAWQGRKLGKLEIDVEKGKIKNHSVDLIDLGQGVPDDQEIKAWLPNCFSYRNCRHRKGQKAECSKPGTKEAYCSYRQYAKIPLEVIVPEDCLTCNPKPFLDFLKSNLPGVEVIYLTEQDETAKKLLQQFGVNSLPAYFIGREVEKEANFPRLKDAMILKGDYYWFNPSFSGISYFMNRPFFENKLDLFVILNSPATPKILETAKKFLDRNGARFKFQLHFLAPEDAAVELTNYNSKAEVEEEKKVLCINQYLPERTWEYLFCRVNQGYGEWWEGCLKDNLKLSPVIKKCAEGKEGGDLLKENLKLTRELNLAYGPLFLLNNKEVFGVDIETTVEELERFILKNR